ncbi:MAG: IS1182 family transposase [Niameybacter sp.]
MTTFTKQQPKYTHLSGDYQLSLPINFETFIAPDDSVRLLSHLLEELNYTKLYQAYSQRGRKPGVEPKVLFKVVAYAFMQRIYSTRTIENACKRDINFIWLLQDYAAPDHSTIARFIKTYLGGCLEDLFYQLILKLASLDEIKFENLFVDGTKIEANANKYTFVWKKVVNKNEAKMHLKITELIDLINTNHLTTLTSVPEESTESLEKVIAFLKQVQKDQEIIFVYGTGKRKSLLQKCLEQAEDYLMRQKKYNASHELFKGRNSYSKTDTDAIFMHMKDDHMRNAQLKPGYNIQIGVESEYVVSMDLFQNRSDVRTLIPFLETMFSHLGKRSENIIADAGYESEENYLYLEEKNQTPYVKPVRYEKWKKKSFKRAISKRENMSYDEEGDYYTCANNKKLSKIGTSHTTSSSGYVSELTIYECEDCSECPVKSKCTKATHNRQIKVSKQFISKRAVSYENIKSEKGTMLRMNRSIQVEGAFGVLKWDHNFNRFLRRGKNNVKIEFMRLCFAYNINKLHAKIQNKRCEKHLHPLKTA